jgi:copper(I)-binding protein
MKTNHAAALLAAILAGAAGSALAAGVAVSDAWARATLPGQRVAGVYMRLESDVPARLAGVSSPAANRAEVHQMRHENGVMKMRKVESLDLPAGRAVKLEPGGYHVMLFDIRRPLEAGTRLQLTLIVEHAGKRSEVPISAQVRPVLEADEHDPH